MAAQGAANDWLFEHPYDGNVTNQPIGTTASPTGSQTFSVYRQLVTNGALDLIQNFQATPTIMLNGVTVSGTHWSIDQYGTLSWVGGYTPSVGQVVSWTGAFYYRCHFLDDEWSNYEEQLLQIWQQNEVKFRSVLL